MLRIGTIDGLPSDPKQDRKEHRLVPILTYFIGKYAALEHAEEGRKHKKWAARGQIRWLRQEIHKNDFNIHLSVPYFNHWCHSAIGLCLPAGPIMWQGTSVDCRENATT